MGPMGPRGLGLIKQQKLGILGQQHRFSFCTQFSNFFLLCSYYVVIIILIMMIQGQGQGPGARGQGQDPTKSAGGPARGRRFFWVLALGPGPYSACTRVLCMHKSVVHAQESCACTRILCMHKNLNKQTPVLGKCAASDFFQEKYLKTNNAYLFATN